jgi:HK97 family phage major capsid protein
MDKDLKALVEFPSADPPTSAKELGEFVAKSASALKLISEATRENTETNAKLAADLKSAADSAKAAEERALEAERIAKSAARTAPGFEVSESALRSIPLKYDPSQDETFKGKMSRAHYNLLMLDKSDRDRLDDPARKTVERFQELHDTLAFVHTYMLGRDPVTRQNYLDAGGMKGLKLWKQYEPLAKQISLAMDTTQDVAWVPTGVGVSLAEDLRPMFELVRYIPTIPMPRSPYQYPVLGAHFLAYLATEATGDTDPRTGTNAIGKRDVTTSSVTFTAKKAAAVVLTSTELEEDSIVPIVAAIRGDLATAVAAAVENCWLNGQLTGTIDTGDVPGSTDYRKAWDGLRYFAEQTGVSYDFGSGLVAEGLRSIKGQMKKYGKDPASGVFVTGYSGFAAMLTLKDSGGTSLVLTQDKLGANATLVRGTLGFLFGSPVVVSDYYPENMTAAGIVNAGNRTGLLYFNREMFRHGEVRLSTIEASRDWAFDTDQVAFKVTYRASGKPIVTPNNTTCKSVGKGVNIATA